MKKTLAALIVGAFTASAANAVVVYDNNGSKVEIGGSVRLLLEKTNKDGDANHTHSGLKNAGSRLEVKAKHNLESGYYALGQLQIRLDGKQSAKPTKDDKFGALSTKRAFIGLGHKEFGEVRFGLQTTFADSLSTAKDRSYGLLETGKYIPTDGNSVVRYIYKGIEGVEIGADYLFAVDRDENNEVKTNALQNAFQVGASYEKDGVIAKVGFGRTNYQAIAAQSRKHTDGILTTFGYEFDGLTLSLDSGYAKTKFINVDKKENRYFVSPGFQYQVTDLSSVYANYKYERIKEVTNEKTKYNGFLLGADYKLHKQVLTYVEGKYLITKEYNTQGKYKQGTKVRDKAIGVGLRVFF
ncbi:porin [Haemophilus influenzae]|uniref:porin n=1 Tax=Haemophilus influenzae TaxID=727 RepID=UPI000CFEEA4A|nr:porin [Haemophilus influenzae]PRI44563.1 Gram-negative porin [Haemophilus influenzae]PRM44581.1 Gram-negative porin [Haemophilus influenzae]